jgi:3-hydroxybutyryl-CoA dehydrogenase
VREEPIRRVAVAGAGAIGRQIAAQAAWRGFDVSLYDCHPAAADAAPRLCADLLIALAAKQGASEGDVAVARSRLTVTNDPGVAAESADLLIESVPELLKVKRDVFSLFDRHCPPQTVFATNTSMLLPSMLAAATGRPDRFAALHFIMDGEIVEIMPHAGTAAETLAVLNRFAADLGHLSLVCRREQPGYLVNTMLMALNASALTLVANGVASFEDVDRAWMKANGVDRGPFGILDLVGLDTAWQITDYGARWTGNAQTKKNADYLKQLVDAGRCGVKAGQGFYEYPDPEFRRPEFLGDSSVVRGPLSVA